MAPTVYKSSDTSAPTLTGQVGSLIGVLDACLVNGYGSKTAAGWTKAFTATNKGSYLGTAGHYLDVDDSGAGAAAAQEATVRGYETMTAVGTGTGAFPTTTQAAAPGLYIRKSSTASTTTRTWMLIADGTTFHLFVLTGDLASNYMSFSFGRFYSVKSSDTYRSTIVAHSTSGGVQGLDTSTTSSRAGFPIAGFYTARVAAGTGTAVAPDLLCIGATLYGLPMSGTNLADSNIYLSRLFVSDDGTATNGIRGYLRGVYQILTGVGLTDGNTFSGTGDFSGRTFLIVNRLRGGQILAVETTAWDSST